MFFSQHFSFPASIIPPMLHTHLFIYYPHCITFFSQYFSFSCQYHSTNVPYSFIHLPPTLYNVFLPVLPFSQSVSFHQCSILIHSTTTTLYNVFLPVLQFPISITPPVLHSHSFIYHRRSIMFFSQYFSFPSVSLHQCSTVIHSSATDAL